VKRRTRALSIAASLSAGLVSACVAPPPQPPAVGNAPAKELPKAKTLAPVPEAAPETALAPPPAPVVPKLNPDELRGSVSEQVTTLLGDPDFRRDDAPAQLMQYRGARCILDLFLYVDEAGGPHRVAHIETRGRTVAKISGEDCLQSLLQERQRDRAAGHG